MAGREGGLRRYFVATDDGAADRAGDHVPEGIDMPNSRPVAPDLLAVVQHFLENEISPQVSKVHQFQLRIVSRVLGTVQRELQLGRAVDAAETNRLRALLGREGSAADLNAALARAIREGDFPVEDPQLLAHMRETIEASLRINNPKWLDGAR
jgi:hypothetical protein